MRTGTVTPKPFFGEYEHQFIPREAFAGTMKGKRPDLVFGRWIAFQAAPEIYFVAAVEVTDPGRVVIHFAPEKVVSKAMEESDPADDRAMSARVPTYEGVLLSSNSKGGVMEASDGSTPEFRILKDTPHGLPCIASGDAAALASCMVGSFRRFSADDPEPSIFISMWDVGPLNGKDFNVHAGITGAAHGVDLGYADSIELPDLIRQHPPLHPPKGPRLDRRPIPKAAQVVLH